MKKLREFNGWTNKTLFRKVISTLLLWILFFPIFMFLFHKKDLINNFEIVFIIGLVLGFLLVLEILISEIYVRKKK